MDRIFFTSLAVLAFLHTGCVSAPPQIIQLHQKELEVIQSVQNSHLAMVDAYVDQKILVFENFYFREYGPSFLKHWRKHFKDTYGRDYDEDRDFHALYNDLVAEYQSEVAPIETIRKELRDAISGEYRNIFAAHEAVNGWIKSVEKLSTSHKESIDLLLGSIKSGLSLDSVDEAIDNSILNAKKKLTDLSK
ncbi:MAG: hypothetical protein ACYC09_14740 [Bacteroidota bacterium]